MIRSPFALSALLALVAAPALAADVSYQVSNASELTILEFTSPADEGAWGDDLLAAGVLPPGQTGTLTISEGSDRCATDLRFILEDGQEFIERVDICGTPTFTFAD